MLSFRTKSVDGDPYIHLACHGGRSSGQPVHVSVQGSEATAEGAVQAFDIGRVEYLAAEGSPQQGQKAMDDAI